ncbi:hypothetical protein PMIN04_009820 [Paraphaeosphaeria minitans]
MAPPSFGEILRTKQFTFLIGPEQTPIVVHAGAIASLSKPLDRLVNGGMLEAQENVARFPELQAQDFERICEFSYCGNYTIPKPEQFSDEHVDALKQGRLLAAPISSYFEPSFDADSSDRPQVRKSSQQHSETIDSLDLSDPIALFRSIQRIRHCAREWPHVPRKKQSWRENFAPVLLAHARLYAFAEQYLITRLKDKALKNVIDTLSEYALFASGLEAVTHLARFTYDSNYIPDREEDGSIDPLRGVVAAFVVARYKYFSSCPGHRQLLKGQNEYAADVFDYVAIWFDPERMSS